MLNAIALPLNLESAPASGIYRIGHTDVQAARLRLIGFARQILASLGRIGVGLDRPIITPAS